MVAVADRADDGAPGAILSLLVSNSLERIFTTSTADEPTKALTSLDCFIRSGLNQDLNDSESKEDRQTISDGVQSSFLSWQGSQFRRGNVTVVLFKP